MLDFLRKLWSIYLWFINHNTYRLIVFQFVLTFLLAVIPREYWAQYYFLISNLLGYSIISNSLIAPKIWKETRRFCEVIKAMILSLIISNTFSIIALWTSYEFYTQVFDRYFLVAFCVLFWMYYIRKKKIYKRL